VTTYWKHCPDCHAGYIAQSELSPPVVEWNDWGVEVFLDGSIIHRCGWPVVVPDHNQPSTAMKWLFAFVETFRNSSGDLPS
jgi:hypothetical protein